MPERPFSPWPFWARFSGLILSYFILSLALTIARLCQEDFQDVGFVSERVARRVETASRKAWHLVRMALGQGPAVTGSGEGSRVVALSVCSALQLGSTVVWRWLLIWVSIS